MPWERIHRVSIATSTVNMALDLEDPTANERGTRLEAVTKDQLNTGLTGQIRYRVGESNLYAFLFGIKKPFVHVMAYFVSVLRQRIANFEAKPVPLEAAAATAAAATQGPAATATLAGAEMTGIIAYREDWIDQLYVLPKAQGRGCGTALLRRTMRRIMRSGRPIASANLRWSLASTSSAMARVCLISGAA